MLLQPYHSENSRSQQPHARNQGKGPNVFIIYHKSLITSLWITWVKIPGSPFLWLASGKKLNTKEQKKRDSSCPKILPQWVCGWNSNSALQWGHTPFCPGLLTSRTICFPSLCLSSTVEKKWLLEFSYGTQTWLSQNQAQRGYQLHLLHWLFLLSGNRCLTRNSPIHVLMARSGFYGHP